MSRSYVTINGLGKYPKMGGNLAIVGRIFEVILLVHAAPIQPPL